jgi:phospholipid/cholesterol/gamma-HCH transport system ATP-binding protein
MAKASSTGDPSRLVGGHREPLLKVRDLCVRFDSQEVLRKINLAIPHGQTLAIIGESGCGKTVLLKTFNRLVRPSEGSVAFDGNDLSELTPKQLADERLRFGFVFQHAALFDSMTVGQNVAFPLRQHKYLHDREIEELVLQRLAEVGLPVDVIWKKPAELSGGMRKRVGLARSLIMKPEVLLYDEPTTGMDPIVSDVINQLIKSTRERYPVTSIIVTHDMRTAREVADRVIMLYPLSQLDDDAEQIIFDGSPRELDETSDERIRQFVQGEAGERLTEMRSAA